MNSNPITEQEARTVALLRLHFGCSLAKLAMCCEAIWGADRCETLTGYRYGAPMGQALLIAMENHFEMERGEAEWFAMGEQHCSACSRAQVAISPKTEKPKECGHCGQFQARWVQPPT